MSLLQLQEPDPDIGSNYFNSGVPLQQPIPDLPHKLDFHNAVDLLALLQLQVPKTTIFSNFRSHKCHSCFSHHYFQAYSCSFKMTFNTILFSRQASLSHCSLLLVVATSTQTFHQHSYHHYLDSCHRQAGLKQVGNYLSHGKCLSFSHFMLLKVHNSRHNHILDSINVQSLHIGTKQQKVNLKLLHIMDSDLTMCAHELPSFVYTL